MADDNSMLNTPPTFAWYMAGLVFKWLQAPGRAAGDGATAIETKAQLLYATIDALAASIAIRSRHACRSWMNVPFTLRDPKLDETFLTAGARGGPGEPRGTPLRRRHAREPLQRHAA